MKNIFILFIVVVLLFCLVSCDVGTYNYEQPQEESTKFLDVHNSDIRIWTDVETGVQYIVFREKVGYAGLGGITPRLNADGTLYLFCD